MRRRKFITLLGGAAVTPAMLWPLSARAQQSTMPVVGFISSEKPELFVDRVNALRQGLSQAGYDEGRNIGIEYRWAEGRNSRLPSLVADLVGRKVSVIIVLGSVAGALAAKAATTTIPVVFQIGSNPVEVGLVTSLSRPGGNVTGVTSLNFEVGSKRLELLHELVPKASVTALLINPTNPSSESLLRATQVAAQTLGLQNNVLRASTESELESAFTTLVQLRVGGLVIGTDSFLSAHSQRLAALALQHAVPAIYQFRAFSIAGGLASYGGSSTDVARQAGGYVARILKGEKPADLPVVQSTKVELIINLKTAKALGLTVPPQLLGRADEIIE